MTRYKIALVCVCAVLAFSSFAQTPPAKKGGAMAVESGTLPGTEKWMDIPAAAMVGTPSVDIGGTLKLAVLQGDPMTPGRSYVVRLSGTDGAKIPPHWHPKTENVTVIKGTFLLGMGSKWDASSMKEFPVGGFVSIAPEMRHYAQCKGDSIVQVNGIAPLVINFVAPDDAPAAKKN